MGVLSLAAPHLTWLVLADLVLAFWLMYANVPVQPEARGLQKQLSRPFRSIF